MGCLSQVSNVRFSDQAGALGIQDACRTWVGHLSNRSHLIRPCCRVTGPTNTEIMRLNAEEFITASALSAESGKICDPFYGEQPRQQAWDA